MSFCSLILEPVMFQCSKYSSNSFASIAQQSCEHQGAALSSLFSSQMQTHRKHLSADVDYSVIVSY